MLNWFPALSGSARSLRDSETSGDRGNPLTEGADSEAEEAAPV